MKAMLIAVSLSLCAIPAAAGEDSRQTAALLRDRALSDPVAWDLLDSLTTEIGPRPVGSEAMTRAKEWAVAKLRALGFENVEAVPFDKANAWFRGEESAEITAPYRRSLAILGLGAGVPTPPEGIEAEIALIDSLAELEALPDGSLAGRIAVLNWRFYAAQGEAGYRVASRGRMVGPSIAATKGASAFLLRSAGTSPARRAHTGITRYADGVPRIPAAALSHPDADLLERLVSRGTKVRLRLQLESRTIPTATAWNVTGELRGREAPEEVVVVGGHLDSWDVSESAADDAAGVAITVAAARLIAELPRRPRRTIRVALWGSEETGDSGAAFATHYRDEIDRIILAGESDLGAGRIYRIACSADAWSNPEHQALAATLAPIGIVVDRAPAAFGGVDVEELRKAGVPVVRMSQDSTDYFTIHHSADDTLNRIDRAALQQNVAAWAAVLFTIAEGTVDLRAGAARP
jgi:hypothetical protein